MTDEKLLKQARLILADRDNPHGWEIWTRDSWLSAADYAIESGDLSELRFMYAEIDRREAEVREESRRSGCDLADYLYENRVAWGMA